MSHYRDAPLCCKGFEEFEYEKLALPDSRNFKVDETSQAFAFETGKSYFKAFELPGYSSSYMISIKSYMIGDSVKTGYIFYPAVIFLDEDYSVTRMMETGLFHYARAGLSETLGPNRKLEGTINIAPDDGSERYMIVLTTGALLGIREEDEAPVTIPFIFPGFVGIIPTGNEKVFVPHSPVGKLSIKVMENDDWASDGASFNGVVGPPEESYRKRY
jgi:maltose operon protein